MFLGSTRYVALAILPSHFTQPFFCAINFEQDRKYMYIVDFILQLRELKEYHT